MTRFAVSRVTELPPIACPCGETRRAFIDDPDQIASLHVVEVTTDSQTHYHKRLTELYYVLDGTGTIELDGETFPLEPGVSVLIKPGCRHRAAPVDPGSTLRLLNVPIPAFDPNDEWFD